MGDMSIPDLNGKLTPPIEAAGTTLMESTEDLLSATDCPVHKQFLRI
jgi:hypothetical protein